MDRSKAKKDNGVVVVEEEVLGQVFEYVCPG